MTRIEREKRTAERMVRLYCRLREGNRELCPDCAALLAYSRVRLDRCPFGDDKGACKDCAVHCYKTEMRERMKTVMRFSGPRMLLYYPLDALRHLFGG